MYLLTVVTNMLCLCHLLLLHQLISLFILSAGNSLLYHFDPSVAPCAFIVL